MTDPVDPLDEWARLEQDPAAYAEVVLGVHLWERQVEIAESVRDVRETYVHTGNGLGKDFVAAVLTLWLLFRGYLVVTTATKREQVEDILWGEIRRLHAGARVPIGGELLPAAAHLEVEPKWYATGVVAKEQNAMQGFHAPRVAAILDEAAGLPSWVPDALAGCCVGPDDRMLSLGNPTAGHDHWFIRACAKGSIAGQRRVIHVSSLESPNYVRKENVIPGLFSVQAEEAAALRWGRESQIYRARVLGLLPTGTLTSLIGFHHIQAAKDRHGALPPGWMPAEQEPLRLGCDVARFGEDTTRIWAVRGPLAWRVETLTHWDGTAIAKRLALHAKDLGADSVAIDGGGLGSGPIDSLRDLQARGEAPASLVVYDVNFGSAPTDELEKEVADRRTELYWRLRDWLRAVGAVVLEDDVEEELLAPTYTYVGKPQVVKLEAKAELKKRLKRSPDDADALALAVSGHVGGVDSLMASGGASAPRTERDDDDEPLEPDEEQASALQPAWAEKAGGRGQRGL